MTEIRPTLVCASANPDKVAEIEALLASAVVLVPRPASIADVVERFAKYHLRALAVVDDHGRLCGMINIEDVLSRLVSER